MVSWLILDRIRLNVPAIHSQNLYSLLGDVPLFYILILVIVFFLFSRKQRRSTIEDLRDSLFNMQ
jgi:hypothetical protein